MKLFISIKKSNDLWYLKIHHLCKWKHGTEYALVDEMGTLLSDVQITSGLNK